jgi:hypothetical protein
VIFRTEGIPRAEKIFRGVATVPRLLLILVHTLEETYGCSVCSEMFARKTGLQSHFLKHSEVNQFTCPECAVTFTRASGPQNYMRIHTGENPTVGLNVLKPLRGFTV